MLFLSFTDDIYNKYHIDLIDIQQNIITCFNNINNNNDDNISVMSDMSDMSDINLVDYN